MEAFSTDPDTSNYHYQPLLTTVLINMISIILNYMIHHDIIHHNIVHHDIVHHYSYRSARLWCSQAFRSASGCGAMASQDLSAELDWEGAGRGWLAG